MSAIDTVWHEIIGQINGIPIYRLKEDAPEQAPKNFGFDGKKGDVLLGGGSGETAAMRISMPIAMEWFTGKMDWREKLEYNWHDISKTFWSNNNAYEFIQEYIEMGYVLQDCPIETWLTEHILSYLTHHYYHDYQNHIGDIEKLEYKGEICSPPEPKWVEHNINWFQRRNQNKE